MSYHHQERVLNPMGPFMRISIVALITVLLSACSTRPQIINSKADVSRLIGKPSKEKTVMFVHVPPFTQTITGVLWVDGKEVCKMPNRSFARVDLSPGHHVIHLKFPVPVGPKCEAFELDAKKAWVGHLALISGPKDETPGKMLVNDMLYHLAHFRLLDPYDGFRLMCYEKYVGNY